MFLVYEVLSYFNNPCHQDGPHIKTWKSGGQQSAWVCVSGRREGPMTQWYQDGGVEIEGQFVGGEREGEWLIYDEKGQVIQRQRWSHGNPMQKKPEE